MTNENATEMTEQQIMQQVFKLIPTLEYVYNRYGNKSVQNMFDEVLDYRTDVSIFPGFKKFTVVAADMATRVHGNEAGIEVYQQLQRSSVLHTQVHLSMLRSFDSHKRLDNKGNAHPNEHYNTLVLQSELLWAAVNQSRGQHGLSANTGLITLSNETSPAYIQYGPSTKESIRLCNNENLHNGLVCHYALSNDTIIKCRREIAAIKDEKQKKKAHQILEKLAAADKFSDGVSRIYAEQIRELTENGVPSPYGIEAEELFNRTMIANLQDESSLTHYIFDNPQVNKFYHETFANIAMGWKERTGTDEKGTETGIMAYDSFWELKDLANGGAASKKMAPFPQALMFDKNNGTISALKPTEIINAMEKQKLTPKFLHHAIFSFLESGILTIGGLAQAPYNTAIKKRCALFIDDLCEKVKSGEFPPLPKGLSCQNLQKRKNSIAAMPTEIPVAGLGILGGAKGYELANYADFIDGKHKLKRQDMQKICKTRVEDAIKAAALTIFEYKLGAKDYQKLVGDEVITFPRTILGEASKTAFTKSYAGKIAGINDAQNHVSLNESDFLQKAAGYYGR